MSVHQNDNTQALPDAASGLFKAPVGAVSPLWGYYASAAAGGVAWWWMTAWTRPINLEALFGQSEKSIAIETMPVLALEAAMEAAMEAPHPEAVEAAPSTIDAIVEPVGEPVVEAIVEVETAMADVAADALATPTEIVEPVTGDVESVASEPMVVEAVVAEAPILAPASEETPDTQAATPAKSTSGKSRKATTPKSA